MTKVYIIRHCETMGNHLKVFQGSNDFEISPVGEKQIAALGERFKDIHIDAVYSSPFSRAKKTAAAIAAPKGLQITENEGLREISGGIIEGKTLKEIFENHKELEDAWNLSPQNFHAEKGESMRSVYGRVSAAFMEIVKENKDKTIAVVSHGAAIRNLFCFLIYGDIEKLIEVDWCDNTAVNLVEFDDNFKAEIKFLNSTEHLSEELLPSGSRITAWTKESK
ncbi:MAG: histidine phosphatase family protein [Clostridia bacterium]|nr:histidine phosphatase family protein [Clostridia bacterium]